MQNLHSNQYSYKNNYSAMAADMGVSVEECAEYLETPEGACESAAWFWNKNGLNALADSDESSLMDAKNFGTLS